MTEVANVVASKNEAMIEFMPPSSTENKIKEDVLVEMRFYMPGLAAAGKVSESDGTARFKDVSEMNSEESTNTSKEAGEINVEDQDVVVGEDGEALTAAAVFCETVKQKSSMGGIQSEHVVKFGEILCLTPRYPLYQTHVFLVRVSNCNYTKISCDYVVNRMITRSCILLLLVYCFYQSLMMPIGSLLLDWSHLFGKVKLHILI